MSASNNALEASIVIFFTYKRGRRYLVAFSLLVKNKRLENEYLFAMGKVLLFASRLHVMS